MLRGRSNREAPGMDAKELERLRRRVRKALRAKQKAKMRHLPIEVDIDELNEIYDCLEASARDPHEWG